MLSREMNNVTIGANQAKSHHLVTSLQSLSSHVKKARKHSFPYSRHPSKHWPIVSDSLLIIALRI